MACTLWTILAIFAGMFLGVLAMCLVVISRSVDVDDDYPIGG